VDAEGPQPYGVILGTAINNEILFVELEWAALDDGHAAALLADPDTCFYVCGLKSMEDGVVLALRDAAQQAGLGWDALGAALKQQGRLHLETY